MSKTSCSLLPSLAYRNNLFAQNDFHNVESLITFIAFTFLCQLINTKESLRELVLEAESLVRQKINDRTSKTEYFFNEIIAKSQQRQKKKMMEKSQKDTVKISRVQVSVSCGMLNEVVITFLLR